MKRLAYILLCAFMLLTGCGKEEKPVEVAYNNETIAEISEENDDFINENAGNDDKLTEADLKLMTPEELFNAFCEGQILAEARSGYDDTTWTMDAGIYQFFPDTSEECDSTLIVERAEPVDLDNDGEVEFVLVNPVYGAMCFDCKDGKVICFAQGEGTAAYCFYTEYDAYWIVHSDTTHVGRCTYNLVKFNGDLEVVDSFAFGWEDWDEDGIKRFYKDDRDITEADYDELLKQVLNESDGIETIIDWESYEKVLGEDKYTSLQNYLPLFENDESFYLFNASKEWSFKDLKEEDDDAQLTISDFSIIDMNGDGTDELILRADFGPGATFVITMIDDNYFARFFSVREMNELQNNGFFIGSGGAGRTYFNSLDISKSGMEPVCFEMRDVDSIENNWSDEYFNEYLEKNYSDPAEFYEINYAIE